MDKCDIKKNTINNLAAERDSLTLEMESLLGDDKEANFLSKIMNFVFDKFPNNAKEREKFFRESIKKQYDNKAGSRKSILIAKLIDLLNSYPGLFEKIKEEAEKIYLTISANDEFKEFLDINGSIDLRVLPENSLNALINKAKKIIKNSEKNQDKLGVTFWGKVMTSLYGFAGLTEQDATGAVQRMKDVIVNFTARVSTNIDRFWGADVFSKGGHTNGIKDVYKYINQLEGVIPNDLKNKLKGPVEDYLHDFLARILNGSAKIISKNKKIQIKISEDIGQKTITSELGVQYPFIYFQNFTDFNEHKYSEKFFEPLPFDEGYKSLLNELLKKGKIVNFLFAKKRIEKINRFAFKTVIKKEIVTKRALFDEFKKLFEIEDIELLRELVKSNFNLKFAKKFLSKKGYDNLVYLKENFKEYSLFNFTNVPNNMPKDKKAWDKLLDETMKENYFPIRYEPTYFNNIMWPEKITELQADIILIEDELNLVKNKSLGEFFEKENIKKLQELNDELASKRKALTDMEYLAEVFDEVPQSNYSAPLIKVQGHLKHVTAAFDPRLGRRDYRVFYDYLSDIFTTAERNNVSLTLIKSFNTNGVSLALKNTLIRRVKNFFGTPDSGMSIGETVITNEKLANMVNKLPYVQVTPEAVERKLRHFNSWLTAIHLRSITTAVVNGTALFEGFFHNGSKDMIAGLKEMQLGGDKLKEIVKKSGITNWGEYINEGLIDHALTMGISKKYAMQVTKIIWEYWKKVSEVNGDKAKEKELFIALRKHLKVSLEAIPSKERIKRRKSKERDQRIAYEINQLANYAITKQYSVNLLVKNIPLKALQKTLTVSSAFFQNFNLPTMSSTEESLRRYMFVVGVVAARNKGLLPQKNIWDYKGEELKKAISYGRLYVEMSAFSMGRENIGEIGQGSFGAFQTKFRIYGMQKFGADVSKIKNALMEVKDYKTDDVTLKDIGKLAKETLNFWNKPARVINKTNPYVAVFRRWVFTQGILTALMDLFVFGPFTALRVIPGLRGAYYTLPGAKVAGAITSDVASMGLFLPSLFAAMAMGDDPEDEEGLFQQIVNFYSRKTMMGFGATWIFDNILMLLHIITEEDAKTLGYDAYRAMSPVIPPEARMLARRQIQDVTENVAEKIFE